MTTEETAAAATQKPAGKPKKNKEKPKDLVIPPKKPKLSKAERRALQEAQRAAKAGGGGKAKAKQSAAPTKTTPKTTESSEATAKKTNNDHDKTISLFTHLPPFRDLHQFPSEFSGVTLGERHENLHPAILKLGLLYAQGSIRGGNARCRAMLNAFQEVLQDYQAPPDGKDLRQHLDHAVLKPSFNYWAQHCRPHSVSMGNAFTLLKSAVATLDRDLTRDEAVFQIRETISAYIRERIDFADQAIAEHAEQKIVDGDVILIYGHSEVIEVLLTKAHEHKRFRVVVVDSRPLLEGQQMLQELRDAGIECCYIILNSLSYIMKEITKVFLGAAALMSDGSVLSRVGTACVALMATQSSKPVLVCCETYKMSNRVQLESITGNELGNPDCVSTEETKNWKETENLRLLNLLYDLTPAEFVSGIVTEMGILPPTSVAVLLREMNPEGRAS